jgi:hypothetical protein
MTEVHTEDEQRVLIIAGPEGATVDLAALGEALMTPERSTAPPLFPTDEQLDKLGDDEFLLVVAAAVDKETEDLNQGGRSARTKFKKRVRARYEEICAKRGAVEDRLDEVETTPLEGVLD